MNFTRVTFKWNEWLVASSQEVKFVQLSRKYSSLISLFLGFTCKFLTM